MKTQKIIMLGCMILVLGFHTGCSSRMVNSERDRTKMVQKEDVRINSQTSELINGNRLSQFTDSTSKFFSIKIFPLDTFTFSVKDGFRGMASKIEVQGIMHERQKLTDSINFITEKDQTVQYISENKIKNTEIRASKEVKSHRSYWFVVLFLMGFIIVLYGLLQILKRFRNIS